MHRPGVRRRERPCHQGKKLRKEGSKKAAQPGVPERG
jgi:hypothetical protein